MLLDRATFPRDKVCAGWLTPGVFPVARARSRTSIAPRDSRCRRSPRSGPASSPRTRTARPPAHRNPIPARRQLCHPAVRVRRLSPPPSGRTGPRGHADDRAAASRRPLDRQRVDRGSGRHRRRRPLLPRRQAPAGVAGHVAARGGEGSGISRQRSRSRISTDSRLSCSSAAISKGYGWCVRKGDYLNVGIGRRESRDFGEHVKKFIALLEARGTLTPGMSPRWRGHAYFASGVGPRPLVGAGMLIAGDSAGLAYPESGEGIQPAIASGRLAAETLSLPGAGTASRISSRTPRRSAACTPRRDAPRRRFDPPQQRLGACCSALPFHEARAARSLVLAGIEQPADCRIYSMRAPA